MLNHIIIMGRLTRDPEQRATSSESSVTRFTVAVDRDFGGRDGGEKQTDFIDCVAWASPNGRKTGDFVQRYFHKGSMIVVSGRLQSRKWQDKEGNNRTSWEINADNVYFGESRRDGDSNRGDNYGNSYSNNSYANNSGGNYGGGNSYGAGNGYGSSYGGGNSYSGGYDAGRGAPPAPANTFVALDDGDGELPF